MSYLDPTPIYPCGPCAIFYSNYKHLLEHLYWRHGTESKFCDQCGLKKWNYAEHLCNILPIAEEYIVLEEELEKETDYCCGKEVNSPMIGCDGSKCQTQWYHFSCVGILEPPAGEWLCFHCSRKGVETSKRHTTHMKASSSRKCKKHLTERVSPTNI